jgi:hypothetical protein
MTPDCKELRQRIRRLADHVIRQAQAGRPFALEPDAAAGLHALLLDVLWALTPLDEEVST